MSFRLGIPTLFCPRFSWPIMLLYRLNISANSISAGCDLTSLMPRYIVRGSQLISRPPMLSILQNIRRGGYIAAIVGICILPWNFLKSSNEFTNYLSAYSVFLSSIAGVMVSHWARDWSMSIWSNVTFRSQNTISSGKATTALLICMIPRGTAGIGTRTASIFGEYRLSWKDFAHSFF